MFKGERDDLYIENMKLKQDNMKLWKIIEIQKGTINKLWVAYNTHANFE